MAVRNDESEGTKMKKTVLQTIELHKKLVDEYEKTCVDKVISAAQMIIDSINNGGCVYICGNGGSAADAQHIAGEFIGRFKRQRKALPAVALSTDTSVLTCVANDYEYEDIFARQIEALAKKGDVLWAFSTGGTSKNIIAAAKLAKNLGLKVLAFTGKADTPLEKISDLCIAIDAPYSAPAQEIHQLAYHTICDLVEEQLAK